MHYTASHFEAMFAKDDEPWQFKSRGSEVRKQALTSLGADGTVAARHWCRPVETSLVDGDPVHRWLTERLAQPVVCHLMEPDLSIDVWCRDPRSVAQREGFV
jgi:hypothetical protein